MEKQKLAIFDLDGTLFDTKDVNFHAYSKAISNCDFNESIDYEYYCKYCNGHNYKDFLPQIVPGISENDMETIHEEKKKMYSSFLGLSRKNNHLFSLINLIKDEYFIALVTTASKENTNDILREFDVEKLFDFVITQEDVRCTKPNPECFETALNLSGVTRENAIIFEDSEAGLTAAESSGIDYIRVYGYN